MNSFLLLCQSLSVLRKETAHPEIEAALSSAASLQAVIDLADQEMLAPALWLALQHKGLADRLSDETRQALRRRYQMNALLNERIREEADHVAELCRSIGVTPAALKGGAFLYEADPASIGARAMRDLDFLVPPDALEAVARAMMERGYRIKPGEDEDWNYTYPGLERPGGLVAIELHQYVGQQRCLLVPQMVWPDVRMLEGSNGRVACLSPAHRVWHNIFHSQVQDRGHLFGLVWLRQLHDLVEIVGRHGHEIDWQQLLELFDTQGLAHVFKARLYQAHVLLGLEWPLAQPPGFREKFHHRHCLTLIRLSPAMWLTRFWAAVTAPLKKYHIDLLYECGTDRVFPLLACRLRHTLKVMGKYRGSLMSRLWERREFDV
ncbi:MAG: nucleotidyltransferase family protein [Alphaproteobacteria bacterium]